MSMRKPRERGIAFSTAMVQAIDRENKDQTRRVIIPQPVMEPVPTYTTSRARLWQWKGKPGLPPLDACPYGVPGDLLYVREMHSLPKDVNWRKEPEIARVTARYYALTPFHYASHGRWRPPRFMPKCLARTWLELACVRREQVQDISAPEIRAEGISGLDASLLRREWQTLWDSINAARGFPYDGNPWVWALTLRRIER